MHEDNLLKRILPFSLVRMRARTNQLMQHPPRGVVLARLHGDELADGDRERVLEHHSEYIDRIGLGKRTQHQNKASISPTDFCKSADAQALPNRPERSGWGDAPPTLSPC